MNILNCSLESKYETSLLNVQKSIKPFLKWAGGKKQLIPELLKYVPKDYDKYIEPFIGGGAFFFHLNPKNAVISDLNFELILTYNTIRDSVENVITTLNGFKHDEEFFYNIRSINPETLSDVERTARLLYLNKTCFNGLYRVNKKGLFNVPYGKGTGKFYNPDNLRDSSEFLQYAHIEHSGYLEVTRKYAKDGDFIFLDPPYYPININSNFKRYTKEFFYHDDHIVLKKEFDRLVNIGCSVILTNSDHPFILDLYKDYEIKKIETKRMISSNANTRKGVDIIVIGKK